MTRPPFFVGGGTLLVGYLWGMLRRAERPVSKDLIAFQRREQMWRLRHSVLRGVPFTREARALRKPASAPREVSSTR